MKNHLNIMQAYLIVASKVEKLACKELYTFWIWIGLEHRPKQAPSQDVNNEHCLQQHVSLIGDIQLRQNIPS